MPQSITVIIGKEARANRPTKKPIIARATRAGPTAAGINIMGAPLTRPIATGKVGTGPSLTDAQRAQINRDAQRAYSFVTKAGARGINAVGRLFSKYRR